MIKEIKTEKDYEEALKLLEDLMDSDPDTDSEKGKQLSLLCSLIQDYEARVFSETLPDPIDAINSNRKEEAMNIEKQIEDILINQRNEDEPYFFPDKTASIIADLICKVVEECKPEYLKAGDFDLVENIDKGLAKLLANTQNGAIEEYENNLNERLGGKNE